MSEAENASQLKEKAKHLDQSGCNPLLDKCRTNLENPASELTKVSGLVHNNSSQHTRLEDVSYVSSNGRSVVDTERNSNYSPMDKEPLCEDDWQGLLNDTITDIDLQSNVLEPCMLVSDFFHTEQQKEFLHPGENLAGYSHDHSHDNISKVGNIDGVIDKSSCDTVPAQLTNNCTDLSNLKQSDEDFYRSPENIAGAYIRASNYDPMDISETASQEISKQSTSDHTEVLPNDASKSIECQYQVVLALQSSAKSYAKSSEASLKNNAAELKSSTLNGNTNCRRSGAWVRKSLAANVKSEYALRSSSGGRRSPKSSIQVKNSVSEPDDNADNSDGGRKRGRRKGHQNNKLHDEFSKMKVHLRYLLHRMRNEQNLIDAYSSEGWRGQSLEKLRPEKELQRAKLDINRSKLKIRGLFQRIDAICAQGRLPESLFDSEGLIDCEDIFCAKCGSKDFSHDNDIILCDSPCDRGFHQLCLDPPLRTKDIPPGDEGWLCPACVCKFDCIQLLNESVGAKVSNSDNWEHVFPEALKTGSMLDDPSGLPFEDSEDDDYNPDGAGDDQDHHDDMVGNESASDESDFSSASEDDDYNPNFAHTEEQSFKTESSSSDFTSASEDLHAISTNDEVSSKQEPQMSPSQLVQELDNSLHVSRRREVEGLDYKKLYEETYGNSSTDSSEDEDWKDTLTPKRRSRHRNISSESNGEEQEDAVKPKRRRYGTRKASSLKPSNESTSTTRKAPLTAKLGVSNISETSKISSCGKRKPYQRLGQAVTQRLYASFKENQYPDRSTKEKLAAELGISSKQVDKWFGNARWSFNHPSSTQDASTSGAVSNEADKAIDGV